MMQRYNQQASISEENWYRVLRIVLPEEYRDASPRALDEALQKELDKLPPEMAEFSLRSLGRAAKSIGRTAAKLAPTVAPIVGGAVGTAVLGPGVGTALGTAAGNLVGGAVRGSSPSRRQRQRPRATGTTRRRNSRPSQSRVLGSQLRTPAALQSPSNQLLIMINNPQFLIALMREIFGRGRPQTERAPAPLRLENHHQALVQLAEQILARSLTRNADTYYAADQEAIASPEHRANELLVAINHENSLLYARKIQP